MAVAEGSRSRDGETEGRPEQVPLVSCGKAEPGILRAAQVGPESTAENKSFRRRCHRGERHKLQPGHTALLAAPLPPLPCPQLGALVLPFHQFSEMSVWEQTESERVFPVPLSHAPPVTALVCACAVCCLTFPVRVVALPTRVLLRSTWARTVLDLTDFPGRKADTQCVSEGGFGGALPLLEARAGQRLPGAPSPGPSGSEEVVVEVTLSTPWTGPAARVTSPAWAQGIPGRPRPPLSSSRETAAPPRVGGGGVPWGHEAGPSPGTLFDGLGLAVLSHRPCEAPSHKSPFS